MLFDKKFLQDMGGKTIADKITGQGRWTIYHQRIFEVDGKFYETAYSVGATEQQDEAPYEYDKDKVECPEMFPVKRTITMYESKSSEQPSPESEGALKLIQIVEEHHLIPPDQIEILRVAWKKHFKVA